MPPRPTVSLVTLGCARNEVDTEELAGRLAADGFRLVEPSQRADVTLVNTCGFIDAAKKDSIDTLLAAADDGPVVAVGCLAERYGAQLAGELPEVRAVLGFDDYPVIAQRLRTVLDGDVPPPPLPSDRRRLLPVSPVARHPTAVVPDLPGRPDLPEGLAPASGPRPVRRRLGSGPVAPLKLATGCDRRCSFCAIPTFRGAFVSRPPAEILAEAAWLAERGVRELYLVSENSTSYGKDLGDVHLLERLLPALAAVDGITRVRLSYLQPAELRPGLVDVLTGTAGVAAYFDLSFQHASGPVLRRMRRFGDTARFLDLIGEIRGRNPLAGLRSNVIVGFPGETEDDLEELERFLADAQLDVVGVFGYSDEDGTEASGLPGTVPQAQVQARAERVGLLAEQLVDSRAAARVGQRVEVLVEQVWPGGGRGRAEHQAPEVDGVTTLRGPAGRVGDLVPARVVASDGVDLVAEIG